MKDVSSVKPTGDVVTVHGKARTGHPSFRAGLKALLEREAPIAVLLAKVEQEELGKGGV
jgi:hypothetical protein